MNLQQFLTNGVDWGMFGLLAASLFFLALSGFSAAGFAKFCKKIWAYLRLLMHPGLQVGKTWLVWGHSTGSFPVILLKKGLNAVVLVGDGKTIYVPILIWDNLPKVTIDQLHQGDKVMISRKDYDRFKRIANELEVEDEG